MKQSRNQLIDAAAVCRRLGLSDGEVFADLGCGAHGHFVFPAAELVGPGGKVYAVDIDKTALHAIERTAKNDHCFQVSVIWSDIDIVGATRIPPGTVDLTLIANNLYLSSDRHGLVSEAIRLTKPGERICVIEWKSGQRPIGPPADARMSEDEVTSCFEQTECVFVERFDAGDEHYALVFKKKRVAALAEALSVAVSQPAILSSSL
ncbi:MAG TPA: methyltransferase domain-containing protein [bacterium]|nr:methyltransferase domain-containing protein [Candidatus Magasanikbacteria bacterium]HPF95407.1 methyltransferase domain-containing protein [bacterium]